MDYSSGCERKCRPRSVKISFSIAHRLPIGVGLYCERNTITDMGKGIDLSIRDKLFEKFVTTSEKGTGLGLYLSKNIIEAHGGKIWVENNNNNDLEKKGAVFAFNLPLSK